ncbi:MAG: cyanophycin synthetase [Candidatus Pacebacteria bacterium]|nr:cyanophycin synthetase [Candidatus Paceibacterota bacterium]
MKNKRPYPYLTNLLIKLAPKLGAKIVVEPEWGIAAQITYKNGVVRSLRYLSLDLNHIASADIAKDKDYAKFFLEKKGYPVAEGETFFSDSWAKAIRNERNILRAPQYAAKLGYPVIVKPNSSSQGSGVCLVWNKKDLIFALRQVFKNDRVAIVERYMPGRDYRVVVLDREIISAYERIQLSVTGDGKSTILKLLTLKQKLFEQTGRDTRINFDDPRIKMKLKKEKLSLASVLLKSQKVYLLDNANLSTGGDATDVTESIHKGFKKIAVDLTRDMGLRIAGVDIMVTKGDITQDPKKCSYFIIEINAAPGLDHYVTTGAKQKKIVEDMYLKVLKALGKKD